MKQAKALSQSVIVGRSGVIGGKQLGPLVPEGVANIHGRGRPLSALVTTLQIGAGNALVHSFAQILFNQHDENRNNQDQGQDSNQHHDVLPDVAPVLGHPVELLGYVRNVLLIDIVDIRIGHVVIIRLAPQAWGRVVDVYRPFLNRLVDF